MDGRLSKSHKEMMTLENKKSNTGNLDEVSDRAGKTEVHDESLVCCNRRLQR